MLLLRQIMGYVRRMADEFPKIKDKSNFTLTLDYLWCFMRYGTVLDQYVRGGFYKLKAKDRARSMTYRRISKAYNASINPEKAEILNNKVEFNNHFDKLISRGWLSSRMMSFTEFDTLCNKANKQLIVKPLDGNEGRGIYKVNVPKSCHDKENLYKNLHNQDVIIEEALCSHKDIRFNATSLNTIRAHSITDANGDIHVFKFILRVGVGNTPVDNYCAGGCIYEVDVNNGVIISDGYSKVHGNPIKHPGTDITMRGYQLPYWTEVIELVKKAHKLLPEIKFIGWDVAITENGPELIEGNLHPDYDLLEFVGTRFWWPTFKKLLNL